MLEDVCGKEERNHAKGYAQTGTMQRDDCMGGGMKNNTRGCVAGKTEESYRDVCRMEDKNHTEVCIRGKTRGIIQRYV